MKNSIIFQLVCKSIKEAKTAYIFLSLKIDR